MTFLDNIEALAKAATHCQWLTLSEALTATGDRSEAAFMHACSPAAVLAMAAVCRAAKVVQAHFDEAVTPDDVAEDALRSAIAALDSVEGLTNG